MNASEPKSEDVDPNEVNPADYGITLNANYKLVHLPSGEISIRERLPNPKIIIHKRQPSVE